MIRSLIKFTMPELNSPIPSETARSRGAGPNTRAPTAPPPPEKTPSPPRGASRRHRRAPRRALQEERSFNRQVPGGRGRGGGGGRKGKGVGAAPGDNARALGAGGGVVGRGGGRERRVVIRSRSGHVLLIDSGLVDSRDLSGRGAARPDDAQGTPTHSHISPRILLYEETLTALSIRPQWASQEILLRLAVGRGEATRPTERAPPTKRVGFRSGNRVEGFRRRV